MARADEIVITACPDLANLRNTKNLLERLDTLRPNDRPPLLVMNQVGVPGRPEIAVADFCAPLDIEPTIILPFNPQLFGSAANNGQMISEVDPSHDVAEQFHELARVVTGKGEIQTQKKSRIAPFLDRLRKKK